MSEVLDARGADILVGSGSCLNVIELSPGQRAIAIAGQPATIALQGDPLALSQISDILLALIGAKEIKNLEALEAVYPLHRMEEMAYIDYVSKN